ncbi:MAG: class I SAM-dependent methyltransferase [Methyloprofundus sp.]|nr:class I SAM-dependent methyltransferase [Methyloprofundus sp.]
MFSTRFTQHSLVTEAHKTIRCYQATPKITVDATMGNGHDTDFLACHSETVYAFDIQKAALNSTEQRLQKTNRLHKVHLIQASHELMQQYLPGSEKVDVFMFNLGYLPHSDEAIITQTTSTLLALESAINYLSPTGIISIMTYPGHNGGKTEMDAVINWLHLQSNECAITHIHSQQETATSPHLFTLVKQ